MITAKLDTDYEAKAVKVYDEDGSDFINDWLRSEQCDPENPVDSYREHNDLAAWETDEVTKINRLDEAISDNEATKPLTLWRGLNPSSMVWDIASLEVGDVISDPAFLSTTTKQSYARSYAVSGYTLKINAKEGATMLRVDDHLVDHGDHVILPRSSKLVVQDVDHDSKTITVSYQ